MRSSGLALVAALAFLASAVNGQLLVLQNGTTNVVDGETYIDFNTYEDAPRWCGRLPETPGAAGYRISCFPKKSSEFELVIAPDVQTNAAGNLELVYPPEFCYTPGKDEYSSSDTDFDIFSFTAVYQGNCPRAMQVVEFGDIIGDTIDRSGETVYCKAPIQLVRVYIDPVNDAPIAAYGEPYLILPDDVALLEENVIADEFARQNLQYPYAASAELVGEDIDGDLLTYSVVVPPENGQAWVIADNVFKYVPRNGYIGPDQFTYMVDDRRGGGHNRPGKENPNFLNDTATVMVTVGGQLSLPLVFPSSEEVMEDTPMQGRFYRQVIGGQEFINTLQFRLRSEPVSPGYVDDVGEVVMLCEGKEVFDPNDCESEASEEFPNKYAYYNFTPAADFYGAVTFTFDIISDVDTESYTPVDAATVLINVKPVNDAPDSLAPIFAEAPMIYPASSGKQQNDTYAMVRVTAADSDSSRLYLALAEAVASAGTLYTRLASPTEVDLGSALSFPLVQPLAMECARLFGNRHECSIDLYYVAPEARRGTPLMTYAYQVTDTLAASVTEMINVTVGCAPGFRRETPESTFCVACGAGSFAKADDSEVCSPCLPGQFSGDAAEECLFCGSGTYQPEPSQASCLACPQGATSDTGSVAVGQCFCDAGYYGAEGVDCTPCPQDPEGGADSWSNCRETGLRWPLPAMGSFVDTTSEPVTLRTCFPLEACMGLTHKDNMTLVESGEVCAPGYTGYACSLCAQTPDKYYRFDGECKKCPKKSLFAGYVVAFLVVVLLPLLLKLLPFFDELYPLIDAVLLYTQCTAVLSSYNLNWPKSLDNWFQAISIFNLNLEILHIECRDADWDFEARWKFTMAIPVMALGLLIAVNLLHALYISAKGKQTPKMNMGRLGRNSVRAFLNFLHMAYIFLGLGVFEFFDCIQDPRDNQWYLESTPSIQCYTKGTWDDLLPAAVVCMILYPVGIIVISAALLFWAKDRRDPKTIEGQRTRDLMGVMYERYSEKWYWFEVPLLCRLLVLVALTAANRGATPNGGIELRQVIVNIFVVLACVLLQVAERPFKLYNVGIMETVAFLSNFLTLFFGMFYLTVLTPGRMRDGVTVLNVITIMGTYAIFAFYIVRAAFMLARAVFRARQAKKVQGGDGESTKKDSAEALEQLAEWMLTPEAKALFAKETDEAQLKSSEIFLGIEEHFSKSLALAELDESPHSVTSLFNDNVRDEMIKRICKRPLQKNVDLQEFVDDLMGVAPSNRYYTAYKNEERIADEDDMYDHLEEAPAQ